MELAPEDGRDRGKVNQAAARPSPTIGIGHCGVPRPHVALASNGTSSWTVTPFGVLEATSMRPSS